jgi:hypothetical protein
MENIRTYDELRADWQSTRRRMIELEGKGKTTGVEYENLLKKLRETEASMNGLIEGTQNKSTIRTPEQLKSEYRRISRQMKFLSATGRSNTSDYRSLNVELQKVSELIKQSINT